MCKAAIILVMGAPDAFFWQEKCDQKKNRHPR